MSTLHARGTEDASSGWGSIVAIVAVLGAGALVASLCATTTIYGGSESKLSTTELQIHEVDKRLQLYALKKGLPPPGNGLQAAYGDDTVPKDAWGNPFILVIPGPDGKEYDVISYGSDGAEGGTGTAADLKLSHF